MRPKLIFDSGSPAVEAWSITGAIPNRSLMQWVRDRQKTFCLARDVGAKFSDYRLSDDVNRPAAAAASVSTSALAASMIFRAFELAS